MFWRRDILFQVPGAGRCVALSLDDGPLFTAPVLEVLAAHSARATFFLIGKRAAGKEELLARIRAEGHEIGNHGWRDERAAALTDGDFEAQLLRAQEVLGPASLYRPGSGLIRRSQVAIAVRHGYRCVLGSVYPSAPPVGPRPGRIAGVLRHARPGAIVTRHEREPLAGALEWLLPRLRERGYEVVT